MKKEVINYTFIIIGCTLMAFGVVGFLSPNSIAMGGTGGLAIILNTISNISIGVLFGMINIPLLLFSIKYLGKYFAIKSAIAILAISFCVDLFSWIGIQSMSSDLLLATLYGSVCIGLGIGLIFKGGGSAGGGTIIARIITSKTSLKNGVVILILDAIVIVATAIVFKDVKLALWSMIGIFTTSKMIDVVLTGRPNERIVHISSSNDLEELGKLINQKIGVNGTLVKGKNLSLTQKKQVIFVTVPANRLNRLKQLISEEDNNAKMIVMEATEMLGYKFV